MSTFNHQGKYICECGREFISSQSFNGHKSHCLIHAKVVGKYDYFLKVQEERHQNQKLTGEKIRADYQKEILHKKEIELTNWLIENHICEKCGKVMTEKYGSGRFCSKSCANRRERTAEFKEKISEKNRNKNFIVLEDHKRITVENKQMVINYYYNNPKLCCNCNKVIPYDRRTRKTCSTQCLREINKINAQKAGKISANKRVLRSKNEIYFYELCKEQFKEVKHNEPIFSGWDADVIIEDVKYAVLWNGPWHYVKLAKNQSLSQIQNRDRIKVEEIQKCGYIPYIIKDEGSYNPEFVKKQFNIFISKIEGLL